MGKAAETSGNTKLIFDNLLHEFDAHENSPRIVESLESEHRLGAEFNAPVVLLNQIIQIFTTTDLDRVFPSEVEFVSHSHDA